MMMGTGNKPRVSIGMPVYNGERYIAETLDSLLSQTFGDFEIIICDNASSDRTEEICRSYVSKDSRIRYSRNAANLGAAKNYRRVFELSSGEYFRWANCDDLFAPTSVVRCVEVLDQEPSTVLTYPKTKFIDAQGHIISDYEDGLHLQSPKASDRFIQSFKRLGRVNAIYGLIRSNILRKTGLLRSFVGGDIPLVAELTLYGKFWEIPEYLFYRRFHAEAHSSFKDIAEIQEFFDPENKGKIPFKEWKHLFEHYRSVIRAPLGVSEKIHLGCFLVRAGIWRRSKFIGELSEAMRHLIRRIPPLI